MFVNEVHIQNKVLDILKAQMDYVELSELPKVLFFPQEQSEDVLYFEVILNF